MTWIQHSFTNFPVETKIELKKLVDYPFGKIEKIIILDSLLILKNFGGKNYHLYNYSLKTNTFSMPYIQRGRSKGEVLGVSNIGVYKKMLYLNDFTAKKIMLINKYEAINKKSHLDLKEYSFKGIRYYRALLTDSLQAICTGSEKSKYKIQKIDLQTGKIIDEFGVLNKTTDKTPLHIITKASLTQTLLNPSQKK